MPGWRKFAALALGFGVLVGPVAAQEAAPAFVVTYLEVTGGSATAARAVLQTYAAAAQTGAVRFDALERTDQPYHFAIVETWRSARALADHGAGPAAKAFRDAIAPMLSAPYDERPHVGLSVGPAVAVGAGDRVAVTHVDIIPPKKDEGVAAVYTLAERSRGMPGNIRYDALTQASRANHMTIVEVWNADAAMEAHRVAEATMGFRTALLPISGSLHDQRLYRLLR